MSHHQERKEKNCLNCGATVQGRYCHICGQENSEKKDTFWSLFHHFVEDVTHFDSKFFDTLRYLLFRPGYLSNQYLQGKRASYLDPIRMYLFTSAIFFLIFSSQSPERFIKISYSDNALTPKERGALIKNFKEELQKDPTDTFSQRRILLLQDTSKPVTLNQMLRKKAAYSKKGHDYNTITEYDSIQHVLPKEKRDGWMAQKVAKKSIELSNKYNKNFSAGMKDFMDGFMHRLPYLMFLSLPIFAFILKLLYVRRRHKFHYADHFIFTLHHYIFSFILFLLVFFVERIIEWTGLDFLKYLVYLLFALWCVYLYAAMKNFYKQGYFKTLLKYLLLNFLAAIVILILFFVFLLFSLFQM